ncbi:hypothetical protein HY732_01030 [Candidatus Uhrbacteria bacterium]|nr:hypothetical protein [Candidatus Uhrbacteria bacterium]
MVKYVLNSGGISDKPELSRQFFAELIKGFGNRPRMLLCFFAASREYWEERYGQHKESISALVPSGVNPIFDMAMPETFVEQIASADAVYMCGGDDHLIQYWLRKFDIPKIFEGKTVGTNSGSSHALATYFWTCDWRKCMEGLGIVPIKFLAHYKSTYGADDPRGPIDWNKAYAELEKYGDVSLPIYALEEGHFIVI